MSVDETPRLAPLAPDQWDEALRGMLSAAPGGAERPLNIFTTLARDPELFRAWMRFGGHLLMRGRLSARDRELAILRTAHNCDSRYEWAQHARLARTVGVDGGEIAALRGELDEHPWSAEDRLLLQAADELHTTSTLSDQTWSALAARYDERQLIELPMLVGHYHMVAFALNSLKVQVEDG